VPRRFGYGSRPHRGARFPRRPSFSAGGSHTHFELRHLDGPCFPRLMLVVACLTCLFTSCLSYLIATCLLSCYGLFVRIHSCFASLGIMVCIIA
jgi:hypothetical protein